MDADRIARLTVRQRACLRLVYAHMSSKEIAPIVGVEPGTVDQYVKSAMRILGVSDRRTAARMLAEYESLADHSPALREEQTAFEAMEPNVGLKWWLPLPLPLQGGKPSDLNPLRRLTWVFALMLVIAISFGVFLAGFEALSRMGRALSH